jgi:hypothetical protein
MDQHEWNENQGSIDEVDPSPSFQNPSTRRTQESPKQVVVALEKNNRAL